MHAWGAIGEREHGCSKNSIGSACIMHVHAYVLMCMHNPNSLALLGLQGLLLHVSHMHQCVHDMQLDDAHICAHSNTG